MVDLTPIFQGGEHIQSVTEVVLVNNVTKTIDTTVPLGERWLLKHVKVVNADNVNRGFSLTLYKETAITNLIEWFENGTLNTGSVYSWPNLTVSKSINYFRTRLLKAGNTVRLVLAAGGVSTGSTDADGLIIEYLRYRY